METSGDPTREAPARARASVLAAPGLPGEAGEAAVPPRVAGGRRLPAELRGDRRTLYALAAGLAVVSVAVTVAMAPRTGATFFSVTLVAVAVSVWAAGLGPALLATAITSAGTAVLPLREDGAIRISDRADLVRWLLFVLAALVISSLGQFMRVARSRAEASEERIAILAETHRALEAETDMGARIGALGSVLVPTVADACVVRVLGGEAGLTAVCTAGPAGTARRRVIADGAPSGDAAAWPATARLSDSAADASRLLAELVPGPGRAQLPDPGSAIVVPLSARGASLGVMLLVTGRARPRLDGADLELAREVGRRAAVQLDNARLFEAERGSALALRRSDALKTAMLRAVSHELRTPLTAVTAAAEALASVDDEDAREELRALVLSEARRLERVVGNLLDHSRLEGGILAPRIDDCSVPELVAGSRAAVRLLLAHGEVAVRIDDRLPLVRADPVLTERIVVNLLQNAATHGRPPVEISARRDGPSLELLVADHGPGVAPGLDGAIFEPFVRGPGGGGLGLGLALSLRLAQAQGGDLRHLADEPGACFALRLPIAAVPPPR